MHIFYNSKLLPLKKEGKGTKSYKATHVTMLSVE